MEGQSESWEIRNLPHCPRCEEVELRRHGRVGFLQRAVLPLFGLYPWECGLCRKIYLLRQRSRGYDMAESEIPAPMPPLPGNRMEIVNPGRIHAYPEPVVQEEIRRKAAL